MHEKTLLYGALGFTALAAVYGITRGREAAPQPPTIEDVTIADQRTLSAAEVPIRLTSSDGTGLQLETLSARAVVEDPLAFTELKLSFRNPQARVLEGTFRITLPQGASLSRFAMKVNGAWQEGEVVEKQAARRAYEDFLHKRQDPALMEQGAGNEFTARVFPIPANDVKEIIIAYSEVLDVGAPYSLPLRGLPQLGTLDVEVSAAGAKNAESSGRRDATFSLHQRRFTPAQDFVVESSKLPRSAGLRSENLAIARVVPFATSRPEPVESAIVLVDTSASRALGLEEQTRLVKDMLAKLPPGAPVVVGCFDQDVVTVYDGKAGGFGSKEVAAIVARGALGASDIQRAIRWAGDQAKRTHATRVVLVGDGVATAGETDAQKLKADVEELRGAGIKRMDAIAAGGIRDDAFLRTVVRGVLDRDGVVLDAKLGATALARRLGEATSSGVPVKVEGARWSWPETLDGLQSGDEVIVYAELPASMPMKLTVGTQHIEPDLRTTDRPLVERAWAQAKIQSLVDRPTEDAAGTKRDIIALSTQHRVLSPHTAMLVLETDADYARFGIDRQATIDILTVNAGRIAVTHSPRSWDDRRFADGADANKTARGAPPLRRARRGSVTAAAAEAPAAEPADPTAAAPSPPTGGANVEEREEAAPRFEAQFDRDAPAADDNFGLGAVGSGSGGGGQTEGSAARADSASDRRMPRPSLAAAPPAASAMAMAQGEAPPPPPPPASPAARRVPPSPQPTSTATPEGSSRQVRFATLVVESGVTDFDVQAVLRGSAPQLRACYTQAATSNAALRGRVTARVVLDKTGAVASVTTTDAPSGAAALEACALATLRTLRFVAPGTGEGRFLTTIEFVGGGTTGTPVAHGNTPRALPYEGRFKIVMERLANGDKDGALDEAKRWQTDQPADVMALLALGEATEARGDVATASRAYGSILELFSFRADSRRFAGERLERLGDPLSVRLAADSYGKAVEQRPDHPASHRLYAFTLLKAGEHEKAFEALKAGTSRTYPAGRFAGVDRILREDLGLVAAAWAHAAPARRDEIMSRLRAAGGREEIGPSLRFVLNWETDANDVDFHIYDARGGHAYYGARQLPSGGELYADVTTGYGPECFTIRAPRETRAYPYKLQAHYYSRGPMGYGMGKLQIIDHDGKGNLTFEERPFVVMEDRAYVDLGVVEKTKPETTALK